MRLTDSTPLKENGDTLIDQKESPSYIWTPYVNTHKDTEQSGTCIRRVRPKVQLMVTNP